MKFSDLWDSLIKKKPDLSDDNATVTIKSSALKKLLYQSYEQGAKQGASVLDKPGDVLDGFSKYR